MLGPDDVYRPDPPRGRIELLALWGLSVAIAFVVVCGISDAVSSRRAASAAALTNLLVWTLPPCVFASVSSGVLARVLSGPSELLFVTTALGLGVTLLAAGPELLGACTGAALVISGASVGLRLTFGNLRSANRWMAPIASGYALALLVANSLLKAPANRSTPIDLSIHLLAVAVGLITLSALPPRSLYDGKDGSSGNASTLVS